MTARRQAAYWIAIGIGFGLLLYLLRDILLPFVAGMGIAYLFDPLVDRLERMKLGRTLATTIVTAGFLLGFVGLVLLVTPVVLRQVQDLLTAMPDMIQRISDLVEEIRREFYHALEGGGATVPQQPGAMDLREYAYEATRFLSNLLGNLISGGGAVFNTLSLLVITPIVAFYLLLQWDQIIERANNCLPKSEAGEIRKLAQRIDTVLAGFIRGQVTVCLALISYYTILLSLVGLQFGFVIGLISGALSFIPYLGAMIGGALSIGVAFVQFWPDQPVALALVIAIYVLGQVIEGYFLVPGLVGRRIGLHPVWVIFAIMAGGAVFGFVGVLLAMPIAAVVGVLVRYGMERYLTSRLYDPEIGS